jgi:diguanylate cyclase (GGDEF)-like protein
MLDIDKFKNINDTYGHGVGDEVIRTVAARLRTAVRESDLLGRYGGEEFALVLIETGQREALLAAERIRQLVEAHQFRFDDKVFNLAISLGVAECPLDGTATPRELMRRADEKLYEAKRAGRNRVCG